MLSFRSVVIGTDQKNGTWNIGFQIFTQDRDMPPFYHYFFRKQIHHQGKGKICSTWKKKKTLQFLRPGWHHLFCLYSVIGTIHGVHCNFMRMQLIVRPTILECWQKENELFWKYIWVNCFSPFDQYFACKFVLQSGYNSMFVEGQWTLWLYNWLVFSSGGVLG